MKDVVLAIDIGTTHIKAAVVPLEEESLPLRSLVRMENRPETNASIGICYDAVHVWECCAGAVRCLMADSGELNVKAIGLTGMVDSYVPVGGQGTLLDVVVPWNNPHGGEFLPMVEKAFSPQALWEKTGQALHPKRAVARLLWLREREPDVFRNMVYYLSLCDYLIYRLTGRIVTDESVACRSMLYDMNRRRWDEALCSFAGVEKRLPEIIETGMVAGYLTREAGDTLGLAGKIPVVCCGHDHLCAFSALDKGQAVFNSLGTAEIFTGLAPENLTWETAGRFGFSRGRFSAAKVYWLANLPSSGASYEWLRTLMPGKPLSYEELFNGAAVDNGGVLYVPHLNGSGSPEPDSRRRGAFIGLGENTDLRVLVRAVSEGIGFETKRIMETAAGFSNPPYIIAAGGGVLNRLLLQAKADITGLVWKVCGETELTLYGAARTAARAAGMNVGLPLSLTEKITPGESCPQRYAGAYKAYLNLCRFLVPEE